MPYHLSKARFAQAVEQAIAELPAPFKEIVSRISIQVLDHVTPQHRRTLALNDDDSLLGYYEGVSLVEQSVEHSGMLPGVIYIFQREHEELALSKRHLLEEIRTTVLHEIGHHLGMGEEDLDKLGYD